MSMISDAVEYLDSTASAVLLPSAVTNISRRKSGDLCQRLDWQSVVEKIHEFFLLGASTP